MFKLNNHSFFVIIQVKHKMNKELIELKIWKRQMHVVLHVAWKDGFQKSIFVNKVLKGQEVQWVCIHNHWKGEKLIPKRKRGMVHSDQANQTEKISTAFPHCYSQYGIYNIKIFQDITDHHHRLLLASC